MKYTLEGSVNLWVAKNREETIRMALKPFMRLCGPDVVAMPGENVDTLIVRGVYTHGDESPHDSRSLGDWANLMRAIAVRVWDIRQSVAPSLPLESVKVSTQVYTEGGPVALAITTQQGTPEL